MTFFQNNYKNSNKFHQTYIPFKFSPPLPAENSSTLGTLLHLSVSLLSNQANEKGVEFMTSVVDIMAKKKTFKKTIFVT